MVLGSCFKVPGVLETGSVRVRHVEWHVGVPVVDCVQLLSVHELGDIVLDNWALSIAGVHGSGSFSFNGITPSENVFESRVLESERIDIN